MSAGKTGRGAGRIRAIGIVLAAISVAGCFGRPDTGQAPPLVGQAEAYPAEIRFDGKAWLWVERPLKGPASLVRARDGKREAIATGEEIGGYDSAADSLFWSVRDGKRWTIVRADASGGHPQPLLSLDDAPRGLRWVNEKLYWLRRTSPRLPDAGPFPPLEAHLELMAVDAAKGGVPARVADLPEAEDGAVLGESAGGLALAAYREGPPGSVGIYRVPLAGGAPVRLYSAMRPTRPLSPHGRDRIYVLAPSDEAAAPIESFVLVAVGSADSAEPLCDWLPAGGELYATNQGILYAEQEGLWRPQGIDRFPEKIAVPPGFVGIAAGGDRLLLKKASGSSAKPTLYEVTFP